MTRIIINRCLLLFSFLILSACSSNQQIPLGEKLYNGAKIKIESKEKISYAKKQFIKNTAKNAIRPVPNKKILGIRLKLGIYKLGGENPKTKFKKWLQKMGEPPVLMSSVRTGVTSELINANLFNIGIFEVNTVPEIVEKKHTAEIIYTCHIHKPYTIKELNYSISNDTINALILKEKEKSLIKSGDDYSLIILQNERVRIDALLKENGYFFFNPDYLLFKADSSEQNHVVTLSLTLKDSIPENLLMVYRINNVFIDQDFSLSIDQEVEKERFQYKNYYFLGKQSEINVKPKVIVSAVYLRKDEIYTRRNHNITLNRLMSMGSFKFVSVKFAESDTSVSGYLDATILLTPMPQHTFRAEVDLVYKSNSNLGPRLNLSFINRNTFKQSELLKINLSGSFEAQLNGANKNLFSYSLNPQIELYFPRLITPFKIKTNSIYIPKTRIELSYNYLKKGQFFDMHTFQFIYGYKWKKDSRDEHELNPINISFTSVNHKSEEFIALLDSNPFLKKSYDEQFVAGASYSYVYNEQIVFPDKKVQFYYHFTTETAGNLFALAHVVGGKKISSDNPSTVIGSVFSQFARFSFDGRAYYNLKTKNKLVMRVFMGVAKPYGNSKVLPYVKNFFSGGPQSIRAFQINSLGPGTYHQNLDDVTFLQLGGDIKLEMNAEYRFNIYRFIKGAIFADAGNVWLIQPNPSGMGTPFSFSSFASELAVGVGLGLRIDVSFFVIRFDYAMPLRKPWLEKNNRWVFNQISFGSPTWRKENLILNVAIGYPF